MATATIPVSVTRTAMVDSSTDVAVTLPSPDSHNQRFNGCVMQPVGGNVSFYGPDGTAFTMIENSCYPFEDPNWGGKVAVFRGASTSVYIEIINIFGIGA